MKGNNTIKNAGDSTRDKFEELMTALKPLYDLYNETKDLNGYQSHAAIKKLKLYLGDIYRKQVIPNQLHDVQPIYQEVLKQLEGIEEKAKLATAARKNSFVYKTFGLFAKTGEEQITAQANTLHNDIYYLAHPKQAKPEI